MDRESVSRWLERYVDAWRSNDPEQIGALFTDDADYRYHPYDEPVRGRSAIVASWLEDPDDPRSWEAHYEPIAVDGDVAVATGRSFYKDESGAVERIYDNCYVMEFAGDGRCRSFTEWYMKRPGVQ